jgi:hypothetical protein
MAVLSVDLASKRYHHLGIALLRGRDTSVECTFVSPRDLGLVDPPTPAGLAERLVQIAVEAGARLLLLDGPQAWKAADNGLVHSRIAERALNAPAKTGLPGVVKPGNYRPFVTFSIEVFNHLHQLGWPRYSRTGSADRIAVETFPLAAWRALGIRPLPAKARASAEDIAERFHVLQEQFRVQADQLPTHDDLQALVAGLAGIAMEQVDSSGYEVVGREPFWEDGVWREGYIVNPLGPSSSATRPG